MTELSSLEDIERLRNDDGIVDCLLEAAGEEPTPPLTDACVFLDAAVFPTHLDYLKAQAGEGYSFEDYRRDAIVGPDRLWWSGSVRIIDEPHPVNGGTRTVVWVIYASDEDFAIEDVVEAFARLSQCAEGVRDLLAFSAYGSNQAFIVDAHLDTLLAAGVAVRSPS